MCGGKARHSGFCSNRWDSRSETSFLHCLLSLVTAALWCLWTAFLWKPPSLRFFARDLLSVSGSFHRVFSGLLHLSRAQWATPSFWPLFYQRPCCFSEIYFQIWGLWFLRWILLGYLGACERFLTSLDRHFRFRSFFLWYP